MEPIEFRIAIVPDTESMESWNVTVWMREFSADVDATRWRIVKTRQLASTTRRSRPGEVFSWLMRCLS
jgi:hypothetical protein